jgi:hypothetical protein
VLNMAKMGELGLINPDKNVWGSNTPTIA